MPTTVSMSMEGLTRLYTEAGRLSTAARRALVSLPSRWVSRSSMACWSAPEMVVPSTATSVNRAAWASAGRSVRAPARAAGSSESSWPRVVSSGTWSWGARVTPWTVTGERRASSIPSGRERRRACCWLGSVAPARLARVSWKACFSAGVKSGEARMAPAFWVSWAWSPRPAEMAWVTASKLSVRVWETVSVTVSSIAWSGAMPAVMVSVMSESLSGPARVSTVPSTAQRRATTRATRYRRQ